jgi:hypothetical protein
VSQFEYISIPVSLILTFAVARYLSGFAYLVSGKHTYWVHTLWCIQAVINCALFWWVFWNVRDVEAWTLGTYLLTLAYPGLIYSAATVLMPSDASPETDWREYYFGARKLIFSLIALGTFVQVLTAIVLHQLPLVSLGSLVGSGFISLYLVAFMSKNEAVHRAIVLVNAAAVVVAYAPSIYTPFDS